MTSSYEQYPSGTRKSLSRPEMQRLLVRDPSNHLSSPDRELGVPRTEHGSGEVVYDLTSDDPTTFTGGASGDV